MPWKSDKQRRWGHTAAGLKALGGKSAVAEWDSASKKKKVSIVSKKLKGALGETAFNKKGKATAVRIDVKKHKGDKAELASTIKHELLHVKHPKMTEKEVYKRTAKTKIPPKEQSKLIAKLGTGVSRQKFSAMATKHKLSGKPGDLISKMNESKIIKTSSQPSKRTVAIMGLV